MSQVRNKVSSAILKLIPDFDNLQKAAISFSKTQVKKVQVKIRRERMELFEGLPEEDTHLYYSWESFKEGSESEIEKLHININDNLVLVPYLIKYAVIEYQAQNLFEDTDRQKLKPREERTSKKKVPVVFMERENSTFVIICTKDTLLRERVKMLINSDGKNIVPNSASYKFPADLFNWLFWLFKEKKGLVENVATIQNINAFIGNVVEDDDSDTITGISDNVSDLTVTKTCISLGVPLSSVNLALSINESTVKFQFSKGGMVGVDARESIFDESTGISRGETAGYEALLYIYAYVLPMIETAYKSVSGDFKHLQPDFKRKLGLSVVQRIMDSTGIKIQDLQKVH